MNKIVSIIVPVYNSEKFLPDLIQNLAQLTDKNNEIIFINDFSIDNSQNIIKQFSRTRKNVVLINNKENMGASYCRNIGIKKSRGDFIYFIDSDDLFNPNSLKFYMDIILKTDVDLVTSKNIGFGLKDEIIKLISNDTQPSKKHIKIISSQDKFIASFLTTNFKSSASPLVCWNKLLKKSILKKIGNYPHVFNTELTFCEDIVFMFKYLLMSKKICNINKTCYFHRDRDNSLTHSNFNNKWFDHLKCFNLIETFNISLLKLTNNNIKSLKCQFAFLLLSKMSQSQNFNFETAKNTYNIFKNNLKFTLKTYKHFIKKFFIFNYFKARKYYKKIISLLN